MQTGSVGIVPASNANENPNVFEVAKKCLLRIADLRNGIIKTHEFLSAGLETERAEHDLDQFKLRLEKFSKEIADGYDQLETEAKLLPAQTPIFLLTNRLNQFLLDVATNSNSVEAYMNARDAFDWSSSTGDYINYVCEFLKSSGQTQRGRKPLSQFLAERSLTQHSALENPHRRFEDLFRSFIKSQDTSRGVQCTYKHLEKSAISSVLEIKLISTHNPNMYKGKEQHRNEYVPVDKQVCTMKMLLLVNNGVFEYIQFIAPHEDWTYLETNRKQIDLSAESQYELYQKLTVQGNVVFGDPVLLYYYYPTIPCMLICMPFLSVHIPICLLSSALAVATSSLFSCNFLTRSLLVCRLQQGACWY